ncbi:hypothetical protein N7470_003443 [Penicillium chermesinum]|nr:hypothetical protein N7470_003443 [Penicillium chermesinum]
MFSQVPSIRHIPRVHVDSLKTASLRSYHSSKNRLYDTIVTTTVKPPIELPPHGTFTDKTPRTIFDLDLFNDIKKIPDSSIISPQNIKHFRIRLLKCRSKSYLEQASSVDGYQGVILGHSREVVLDPNEKVARDESGSTTYSGKCYEAVEAWKQGTLDTLAMVGAGDFLAVKLTGAGPISIDAMAAQKPMPEILVRAMDEICLAAKKQGSRLWIDAEQQVLQRGLDHWAIQLMRRHNRSPTPLVYNTIQAYLKGSKANVDRHIETAARETWSLGIKLVRGAYIEHETRSLIHDTKEETDRSYDLIAETLLSCQTPAHEKNLQFPNAALFLATHNAASAAKAISMHQRRLIEGKATIPLECGQIQGMADELSCELVQNYERAMQQSSAANVPVPKAFKCMAWGSVAECMQYLYRRAIENKDAVERTQHMVDALWVELKRRVFG